MKNRIKKVRTDAGLSQSDFAKAISISRSAVCKLESGENEPSEQTLRLLQETFSVNRNWLRTGKGDPYVLCQNKDMYVLQIPKEDQEAFIMFSKMLQAYDHLDSKSKVGVKSFVKNLVDQFANDTKS